LSTIFVDFIFVDFDKILDKFIYFFDIFLGNYLISADPAFLVRYTISVSLTKSKSHDFYAYGFWNFIWHFIVCQGEKKNTVTCGTNEPIIKYVLASKGTQVVYVNQKFQ
jgi:hypothetical protein